MELKEAISQLINLRGHCENFTEPSNENCIWKKDIEALEIAIEILERKTRDEMV